MDIASVGATSTTSPVVTKVDDGKPPVTDVKKEDSSTENLPWHKDERFQGFMKEKKTLEAANAKLQKLLKENDLEDADDLEDLVKSGKSVKGKLTDLNAIDDILAKAAKLDQYEDYWAKEADRKRKEESDPETRAETAERALEQERRQRRFEIDQKKKDEATKKAINEYEREVMSLIKDVGLPKDQEGFVGMLFGVNNPSNDVDLNDRKAIKRLVAEGIKQKEAYDQAVIAAYLKGKGEIVKTGKTSESTVHDETPRMNLKQAHKVAREQIGAMFRGG